MKLRALKTQSWKSGFWQGRRVLGRTRRLSLTATLPMREAFCGTQLSLQPQGERMNLCGGHFFPVDALRSQRGSPNISCGDCHGSWAEQVWIVLKPAAKEQCGCMVWGVCFHGCCLLTTPGLDRNAQSQNVCDTGVASVTVFSFCVKSCSTCVLISAVPEIQSFFHQTAMENLTDLFSAF